MRVEDACKEINIPPYMCFLEDGQSINGDVERRNRTFREGFYSSTKRLEGSVIRIQARSYIADSSKI
ncbi:MAG: hypothetical protein HEEMFOPI_01229 [Holosporales bacterium]